MYNMFLGLYQIRGLFIIVVILLSSWAHCDYIFDGTNYHLLWNIENGWRGSRDPFLSGDTFRENCDYIFDRINHYLNPKKVAFGDVIFVETDLLPEFFEKIHPHIGCSYVLITHNSDLSVPGEYEHMLDDEKILAWFGQNVSDCSHFKLHPIPTGLANYYWGGEDTQTFVNVHRRFSKAPKEHFLCISLNLNTDFSVSPSIYNQFVSEPCCFIASGAILEDYLVDLSLSLFVLSPQGRGIDSHRTWEALYMGAIPIIESSSLDSMYDGLPVVIVKDWKEVTFSFLEKKLEELKGLSVCSEKLWVDYWFGQIGAYKNL